MAFEGPNPIRNKILINSELLKQVTYFTSLGNLISYTTELDISNKLNNFIILNGNIRTILKPKQNPQLYSD